MAIEPDRMPPVLRNYIGAIVTTSRLGDDGGRPRRHRRRCSGIRGCAGHVTGDKTVLQSGMVFAVDGSVSVARTFRAQAGDSFIVTEDGYEALTSHPKALEDVVL